MLTFLPTSPAYPADASTLESDARDDLAVLADENDRSLDQMAVLLDALDVCMDTERLQALAGELRHGSLTPLIRNRLERLVDLAATRGEVDAYRRALDGARAVVRACGRDDVSREMLYRSAWRKHELSASQIDCLLAAPIRLGPPEPGMVPGRSETPS